MTTKLLRRKAVRSLSTTCGLALILAVSPLHAQTTAAGAASNKDADIDAFLDNLQRTNEATRPAAAPGQPVAAAPAVASAPAPAVVPAPAPTRQQPAATPSADDLAPAMLVDYTSPFRTLLLMLGGIAICALATVGLTLTFFALRKDIKKKRRARQRRFVPYPPKKSSPVANV